MIWHDEATVGVHSAYAFDRQQCPFCRTPTKWCGLVPRDLGLDVEADHDGVVAYVCPACGWWTVNGVIGGDFGPTDPCTPGAYSQRDVAATAALKNLDVTDDTTPIDDVRRYLVARAEAGHELHPRLFEETVASVFRDVGFGARVTAYSGDGGIDIVLDGPDERTIGVQVKRYNQRVKVEHIRSFVGALVLEGHCRGIFVTTSDYQKGCFRAAEVATKRDIPVSLITGDEFRDALRIANADLQQYAFDQPPFTTAKLFTVRYRGSWCAGEAYTQVWESDTDAQVTGEPLDAKRIRGAQ